jgi:hypothetical protein
MLFDIEKIFANEVLLVSIEAAHIITSAVTNHSAIGFNDGKRCAKGTTWSRIPVGAKWWI